jgi:hypothetical protein
MNGQKHYPMETSQPHARAADLNGNPAACNAHTRSGDLCRNPAMRNGKCRMHGGKTPSGRESPHYKGAGRARVIPAHWIQSYEESIIDPKQSSFKPDIVRCDAQIDELLTSLPTREEESEAFAAFNSHFAAATELRRKASEEDLSAERREELDGQSIAAFEASGMAFDAYTQIQKREKEVKKRLFRLVEERRKLVDSETKLLKNPIYSMDIKMVLNIVWSMLDIVKYEIRDRETLQRIQNRLREEYGRMRNRNS